MALHLFQERVIEEKRELDIKRTALNVFIGSGVFASLDDDEQARLHHQAIHMAHYSHILADRIDAFKA
jgi:hypothetical protein